MHISVKIILPLVAILFMVGCNRLPYEPFVGDDTDGVRELCSGLWVIDDCSSRYVSGLSTSERCPISSDDHYVWLFAGGKALVNCKRDFCDDGYRYRSCASDNAYVEMCGATTELSTTVDRRFRWGTVAKWKVCRKVELGHRLEDLTQPHDWRWGVEVSAGGHGFRLYIGQDSEGMYLAVPIYTDHYRCPRECVRLRKCSTDYSSPEGNGARSHKKDDVEPFEDARYLDEKCGGGTRYVGKYYEVRPIW